MPRKNFGLDYLDDSQTSVAPRPSAVSTARPVLESLSAPAGYPASLPVRDVGALRALYPERRARGSGAGASGSSVSRGDDTETIGRDAYASSWRLAFSPVRSLITGAFACFMTGRGVHLFSVMTAITISFMQVQQLLGAPATFAEAKRNSPELSGRLVLQFLVYLSLCIVGCAGAAWQCNRLGFLPTTESDFTAWLPPVDVSKVKYLAGGMYT